MTQTTKQPYQWDFDGAYIPDAGPAWVGQVTFSIGIFQWVPRSSRKGLKRGKVQFRVKGLVSDPQAAILKADRICAERNFAAESGATS